MTDKEIQEFFETVKGKKIKGTIWWVEGSWFIPEKLNDTAMVGTDWRGNAQRYLVCEGFNPTDTGFCWKLTEDTEDTEDTTPTTPTSTREKSQFELAFEDTERRRQEIISRLWGGRK